MIIRRGLVSLVGGTHFLATRTRGRLLHFDTPLSCLVPLLPRRRSILRLSSSSLSSSSSSETGAASVRLSSPGDMAESKSPPVAKKVEHVMEMFGDVRVDNYYWLRDDSRSNPDMLSYLREENHYTDFVMSGESFASVSDVARLRD